MSSQHPSRDNVRLNYLEISKNGLLQKPTPKPNARVNGKGKAIKDVSIGASSSASSDPNIDPNLEALSQNGDYERTNFHS
jgi:hypothetical protein